MLQTSADHVKHTLETYVNPQASGRRLIYISHISCVVYAIIMASFSTGLYYAGISMGYLYLMMGVIISGAVLPASLTLLWSRQSWAAATFSPPLALVCSLIAWLVTAKKENGTLSVDSTGAKYVSPYTPAPRLLSNADHTPAIPCSLGMSFRSLHLSSSSQFCPSSSAHRSTTGYP